MQKIFALFASLCLTCAACNKSDNGVEVLGKFADGKVTVSGTATYASNGAAIAGLPVTMQFYSMYSAYGQSLELRSVTDAAGAFTLSAPNPQLPVAVGSFVLRAAPDTLLKYYWTQFSENGVVLPDTAAQFSAGISHPFDLKWGETKTLNMKLFDAHILYIRSQDVLTSHTQITFKVKAISQATGDTVQTITILPYCPTNPTVLTFVSKPNTPIQVTASIFRNYTLSEERLLTVPMDKKDNYLQIAK